MNPGSVRLVLMLKAPMPGTVKTRLAKDLGNERATEIYRKLVEYQASQLPPEMTAEVHYSPPSAEADLRDWLGDGFRFHAQCNGDLGARLAYAAVDILGSAPGGLIFLGGDCPYISAGLLRECVAQLANHDVVVGPARDGGYYLVAIKAIEARLFEGIDWGTDRVLEQTMARIVDIGLTHFLLPELEDVDDLGSWLRAKALLGPLL